MFSFIKKSLFAKPEAAGDRDPQMRAYNKTRYTDDHSSFCYAPSINMYFAQDGNVRLCCHNLEYSIGKYPEQTIREIWNSEAAEKIRRDMREYKLYEGCSICRSDIEAGAYEEVRARHFDSLPQHETYPTMMEFLLTNTCNLECIMCKGEFSSLIRQNREHLPALEKVYDDSFIEQLAEFIPNLHEARFSGAGEAFLIEDNYKIWEMIIRINPKCVIMVQTNGMVLNSRIKDLLGRGNFQLGVSLDSLKKEVFETIRPHAKFERVIENIHYFNDYCKSKKIKFSIAMCVMRQNWQELPDFVNFANSMDITATFHKVYHPMDYSLQTLSKKELGETVNYLEAFCFETHSYLQGKNVRHFQYILDSIKVWGRQASPVIVENLTEEDLRNSIVDKFIVFIKEQVKDEEIADREIEMFKVKFSLLMQMFSTDGKERKVLIQMYRSDFSQIYPYFKQYAANDLYFLSSQLAPDLE